MLKQIKTSNKFGGKKIGIGENEIYLMSLINVKITWEIFSNFFGLLTIFEIYENLFLLTHFFYALQSFLIYIILILELHTSYVFSLFFVTF